MDFQEMGCGVMDRIEIFQDRDRLRAVVIAVMDFRIPYIAGNFLTTEILLSFLEGLCSME